MAGSDDKKWKTPKPEFFRGNRDLAETWLKDIALYCSLENIENEATQVGLALRYISIEEDSKARWFKKDMLDKLVSINKDTRKAEIKSGTWKAFAEAFIKEFQSSKVKEEAEAELQLLDQGTMNIHEFTSKFKELVQRSGITSQLVLKRCLKRSVSHLLRQRLSLTYPQPDTWEEMIERLKELQMEWEIDQTLVDRDQSQEEWSEEPEEDQINHVHSKDQGHDDRMCYYCNRVGHIARYCTVKEDDRRQGIHRRNVNETDHGNHGYERNQEQPENNQFGDEQQASQQIRRMKRRARLENKYSRSS
jgi:hypothetical protein